MTRVLVTYASKHGATAEIAEAIADELRAAGLDADCVTADTVDHVDDYDAVVLGSAVYMKHWQRAARKLLQREKLTLSHHPLWIFSSGYVGDAEPDLEWCEPRKVIAEAERLGARGHVVFGGRVPADGFMGKKMSESTSPDFRDRRDWDEIRAWARGIATELAGAGTLSA